MDKICFQITDNLRLNGDLVISYTTIVARIKGEKILVRGKYSHTTSKHLRLVSSLLKKELEYVATKPHDFFMYEFGVKCVDPSAVGKKYSSKILEKIGEGKPLLQALWELDSLPPRDWEIIRKGLKLPEGCPPPHKKDLQWQSIKNRQ